MTKDKALLNEQMYVENKRNYGIDLLKIISMFMVVVLHVLERGGVLLFCEPNTLNWYLAWLLEMGAYVAVNCFALTTGYLMVDKKYKTSRIISLWLEVVFYSIIITGVMQVLYPQEVGLKVWFQYLCPVINCTYWYFTAYFGLFFIMPLLNWMYQRIDKKQSVLIIIVGLCLFSIMCFIKDVFNIKGGYSMLWLIFLYIIGAHIKKFGLFMSFKNRWFAGGYIVGVLISVFSIVILKFIVNLILGNEIGVYSFVSTYVSPTVVFSSICLFLFFSRLNVNNSILKRILVFLSPLAFGVYIIHMHTLIFGKFLKDRFVFLSSSNPWVLVGVVLGSAIIIYLVCTIFVFLRYLLFKLCKVDKLANKLGDKIDDFVKKKVFGQEKKRN